MSQFELHLMLNRLNKRPLYALNIDEALSYVTQIQSRFTYLSKKAVYERQ
ncbi:hypothetical protein AAKU64_004132 [Undibacterium sp. GrIS 1.8]